MSTAFEDYRCILRVTTARPNGRWDKVMTVLAAVFALAFTMGVLVAAGRHKLELGDWLRAALGLAVLWLAFGWIVMFIPASVRLNSPVNSRLLPRQRRRLIQMAVAAWLFFTAAFAIVIDSWAVLPLVGLYLILLSGARAGHPKLILPLMVVCNWPMLSRGVLPRALVETLSSGPSVLVLSVLLLPVGAWAFRLVYPAGGDTNLDKRAAVIERIERLTKHQAAGTSEIGGPVGSGIRRAYALALRRDCRRAEPATMLMHALGPVAHWSTGLGSVIALPVIGAVLHVLMQRAGAGTLHVFLHVVASAGRALMVMPVLFCTAQFGQQLRRTRGEQALLRLTPLAGDAALLNRRLATRLLWRALGNWVMLTAAILLATRLIGGDGMALLRQFALCCLAGQVALLGLLGDYARDGGWNPMLALGAALLAALEAGVAVGLGWLAGTTAWPCLTAIALLGAVVQLWRSWRRMLAAPVAFPAGRLA